MSRSATHTCLFYLDACARSVLSANDFVTNIKKRLGNRCYTGQGSCRVCGAFPDLQLEHSDTCSTAQDTIGHSACVPGCAGRNHARRRGSYHEPLELTSAASRLAELFIIAAVPERIAALDVCVAFSNAAVALPTTPRSLPDHSRLRGKP